MTKFAHISDIHIHNLKFHKEQKEVFEKTYEHLKKEKVDYIILAGDLFHVKSNVTPEAYQSAAEFLKNLAEIAQTHVILGNHDLILSNKNRLDSVSPVIEALNDPRIFFHKHAEECTIDNGRIALNIMSIVDEQEEWIPISDKSIINIALYHGAIAGVVTDQDFVMEHGDITIDKFKDFDYVLLGDIHRPNQCLDPEGRVRYAGSLCQNNFGEPDNKGFLIWEIEDKEKFSVRHIHIPNPKPFMNVVLDAQGNLPANFSCPINARMRVISYHDLTSDKIRKAVENLRKKYKPESISYQNKSATSQNRASLEQIIQGGNLRDEDVQKSLIKDYLKDQIVSEEVLSEIFALNEKYNKEVEANEEVSRNIHWKVKRLKWNNLFNYGEDNEIDFTKLNGTTGIFGKNFSGKSSIVDSLLFAIYNNTSKNIRKNYHVINQNKTTASCFVEIEADGRSYFIDRTLSKYTKKLKGEITEEAKATVDFCYVDLATQEKVNLNGVDGNETNKAIRKVFGTIEDFFVTSMSSQMGALNFINEGSTRRKEIIAKFLDLEIFESKFKLAKEESALAKAGLRRLEGKDFEAEANQYKEKLIENENQTKDEKQNIEQLKTQISTLTSEIFSLEEKISRIDSENIDKDALEKELLETNNTIEKLKNENEELIKKVSIAKEYVIKAEDFKNQFNIEDLKSKKAILLTEKEALLSLTSKISEQKKILSIYKNHTDVLDKVPCGSSYTHSCDFIKEANEYLQKINVVELAIADDEKRHLLVSNKIESLNEVKIEEYLSKYQQLLDKKNNEERNAAVLELAVEKNKSTIGSLSEKLVSFSDKLKFYEEHKEIIENMKCLIQELESKKKQISDFNSLIKQQEQELTKLYKEHGSLEQKIENIKNNEAEKATLQRQYAAYELFMRCMHNNGIAFGLIKKNLPLVNLEIAKVLSNIVEFEVYFENTDNKLDIFIKHPKYDARPLENGSGAEKTLAAMAIRIALLNISNMPKPNIFILDEPGTALDSDNMEGFVRILDLVKGYFDITVLITHIDALKDSVDSTIEISKNNGFAQVKC
jgi:DNA repair exonuclease SbcCD ATPase subunit/DNA repair exonuclease SbcCD nuclease subunit